VPKRSRHGISTIIQARPGIFRSFLFYLDSPYRGWQECTIIFYKKATLCEGKSRCFIRVLRLLMKKFLRKKWYFFTIISLPYLLIFIPDSSLDIKTIRLNNKQSTICNSNTIWAKLRACLFTLTLHSFF
jgi:hypothetical protein